MIGYLRGKVKYQGVGWIILDVHDFGYKIFTNSKAEIGDEIELLIHHLVREDASDLYGFSDIGELGLFEQLLTVSGVGPKMGLAILSIGSVEKIRQAIIKGDTTLFTSVSGIGKKVAAKIIVELKNKMGSSDGSYLPQDNSEDSDLIAALEQLGYKQMEIFEVLKNIPSELSGTKTKLTWALQRMKKVK
ncbi:MAG: Holliday junction branch migration protein RuvA [bacterium]|nr:Holliday junction branch migration protein RuvA [bacterium]